MGQRSQIYIRYNDKNGKKRLVARYFQWNYGTRMISRARGIIEWCKSNAVYFDQYDKDEKLIRIIETNFDYRDVVLSCDIIEEFKKYARKNESFEGFVFGGQDNNDGQLYIDLDIDWENWHKPAKAVKCKYAFTPYTDAEVLDAESYMQWDEHDEDPWRENEYIKGEVKYTERNIRYINKNAILMTKEELKEFRNYDYKSDLKTLQKGECA